MTTEHADHGRGSPESGPEDPDCPCRATALQAACAKEGCGFCVCDAPADFGSVLDAFAEDSDDELLNELRQLRSDPGTGFDEAMSQLQRRLAHLRSRISSRHGDL